MYFYSKIRAYITHYVGRLAIEGVKLISEGFLPISDLTKKRLGDTKAFL
jgi:hypothetical protein